eukprot:gnl/Chilomastix_caulleri/94.p2 GENE.gnl/Chilomastix_caulleri/94~~gnl/Chilomastix_caulleri/94.p2  ORF type:complete len:61 (+),score=22.53 gnl/Chilomastix_caulleri/94:109-291(+)
MPRKQESGVTDKNPDRQERHSAMKPHSKGGKGDDKPDRVYEDEELKGAIDPKDPNYVEKE